MLTGGINRRRDGWSHNATNGADLKIGKPPLDSGGHGMLDAWEQAYGLSPNELADANKIVAAGESAKDRQKNYIYVEFCLNELADKFIADARGISTR